MQLKTTAKNLKATMAITALFSIIFFVMPYKTVKAAIYFPGQTYSVNMFNWFYGANPNDANYNQYVKLGLTKTRTTNNYSDMLPAPAPLVKEKVLYWDRPVTFYGVPPSPTHGASAITPTPSGKSGIYYDDLAPAGGPVYLSGANYGNGRPVGRVIDTNGGRAIVPGGYSN